MADEKKEPEIRPEHWKHAESGFKTVLKDLEDMGFDTTKKQHGPHGEGCNCHELEAYGEEIHKRKIHPLAVTAMGLRIGARIQFEEDYELNGQPHTEHVDGVIVGIFYDGFAYVKLRPVSGDR